jgi:hypothetical protein|nr:MAG TPA: hypothetical protein [Caudoviricetes sp.]
MADLVTRLILDNKQYNDNIAKSKQQTQDFENISTKITSTIGKFAVAIGAAHTATDAFNQIIHSSQGIGDAFDTTLGACKMSVDAFFQSLTTGNWNAFNDGILSTISNMKEYLIWRDKIGDAKLSMGYNTKVFEREYSRLEGVIDNETLGKDVREKAYNDLKSLINNFNRDVTDTQRGTEEMLIKSLSARFGRKDFTLSDIDRYIAISNNDFSTRKEKQALTEYQNNLKEFEKNINAIQGRINSTRGDTNEFTGETKKQMREKLIELQNQQAAYINQNAELEKQNILYNDNDKAREQMIKDYEYAVELQQRAYDYQTRSLEKQNTILSLSANTSNNSTKVKAEVEIPKGSVAELDKLIAEAKKKYSNAVSDAARTEALKLIEELEQKKVVLNITAKFNSRDLKDLELPALKSSDFDTSKLKLKPIFTKNDVNLNQDYASSINDVASAFSTMGNTMSTISSLTQDGADSWFNYSISLMSAVANAIPAITALTTAKKAEANANLEAAATGAASSVASIPFVGWAMAISAVAAIIAAATNIPKLKDGGVVYGNSIVNVGEYAGASSNPEIISPLSKLKEYISPKESNSIAGDVTFKIRGRELVGILSNYNKKTNKIK